MAGLCPSSHATKAIEAQWDFRLRGGRLTMRRRILPERQSSKRDAISSMYDPSKKRVCGLRSQKARWTKATKSRRTSAAYSWGETSEGVRGSNVVMATKA